MWSSAIYYFQFYFHSFSHFQSRGIKYTLISSLFSSSLKAQTMENKMVTNIVQQFRSRVAFLSRINQICFFFVCMHWWCCFYLLRTTVSRLLCYDLMTERWLIEPRYQPINNVFSAVCFVFCFQQTTIKGLLLLLIITV